MPQPERPLSYFEQLAQRDREQLRLAEKARQRAQEISPDRTFRTLSFQEQMAAIYAPEAASSPETILNNGTRPATPEEIARVIRGRRTHL